MFYSFHFDAKTRAKHTIHGPIVKRFSFDEYEKNVHNLLQLNGENFLNCQDI